MDYPTEQSSINKDIIIIIILYYYYCFFKIFAANPKRLKAANPIRPNQGKPFCTAIDCDLGLHLRHDLRVYFNTINFVVVTFNKNHHRVSIISLLGSYFQPCVSLASPSSHYSKVKQSGLLRNCSSCSNGLWSFRPNASSYQDVSSTGCFVPPLQTKKLAFLQILRS